MRPGDDEHEFPESSWWSRLVGWSLQPRTLGTIALAGLFVVIIPAIPSLWPTVSQREKFKMSVDRIELNPPTRWAPHEIVSQVATSHPEWSDRSLLEFSLAPDLAKAFAKHPWIAKVDRVEKTRQGQIRIDVTYRTPVAMVETHRGLFPVDAEGILLPPKDFSLAQSDQLPHLRQVRSMPNGPAGTPWGDPIVTAGARLCAALMPKGTLDTHWKRYELEAVVAPDLTRAAVSSPTEIEIGPEPLVFELLTQKGHRIIWGRPPGDESLEPTVKQKLGRLDDYLRQYGSLDHPEESIGFDIRGFSAIRILTENSPDQERLR